MSVRVFEYIAQVETYLQFALETMIHVDELLTVEVAIM